jgi:hypoxanthine phosphoribosyltransferase
MNGSIFFLTDLLRGIKVPTRLETCRLQSYHGTASSGKVLGLEQLRGDFHGRDVLVVDDIVDTGLTLSALISAVRELKPRSVKVAVLLSKKVRRKANVRVHYVGFEIPDEFVIGYGLDYEGKYRSLPSIHIYQQTTEKPAQKTKRA